MSALHDAFDEALILFSEADESGDDAMGAYALATDVIAIACQIIYPDASAALLMDAEVLAVTVTTDIVMSTTECLDCGTFYTDGDTHDCR